jgi:hypothetical protein
MTRSVKFWMGHYQGIMSWKGRYLLYMITRSVMFWMGRYLFYVITRSVKHIANKMEYT